MPDVNAALRGEVRARAKRQCEYCLVLEDIRLLKHEIDHIIPIKHGGETTAGNLALCCTICNKYKGTDLASIDPESGEMQRLFHPRRDRWREHFELRGAEIVARTAIGRVTARLLQLNRTERLREREVMIQARLLSL